jgi:hypothetical protein
VVDHVLDTLSQRHLGLVAPWIHATPLASHTSLNQTSPPGCAAIIAAEANHAEDGGRA